MTCEYEDCDQGYDVTFDKTGQKMCKYHATVSMLIDMNTQEARNAMCEANHGSTLDSLPYI